MTNERLQIHFLVSIKILFNSVMNIHVFGTAPGKARRAKSNTKTTVHSALQKDALGFVR